MTRHEYIKKQAQEYYRLCEKQKKLSERLLSGNLTQRRAQVLSAELNWTGMYIDQTEERLAFALGKLLPENARMEYHPSGFHAYPGIRKELEKIKFDL